MQETSLLALWRYVAMPLYEYRCKKCGHQFELLRKVSEADDETRCPKCRSKSVEQQLARFSAGKCSSQRGFG
jgi:putative FmdB family regulatory protein